MKNLFILILFILFSFSLQADNTLYNISDYDVSIKAPQGGGIIHIVQGRSTIRIEPVIDVSIQLTVFDSKRNVVSELLLNQQGRQVSIDTNNYESGTYTLVAESPTEVQEINFIIKD